jgi:hypothetical protein
VGEQLGVVVVVVDQACMIRSVTPWAQAVTCRIIAASLITGDRAVLPHSGTGWCHLHRVAVHLAHGTVPLVS